MTCRRARRPAQDPIVLFPLSEREKARLHARRRAWQRYGAALNDADVRRLEGQIWAGKATWICDQAGMRSGYIVYHDHRPMIAIFDIHLDAIVTFLPSVGWAMEAAQ